MNLKIAIVTFFINCFSIATFAQYTYKQKLGGLATVNMPDKPQFKNIGDSHIYVLNHKGIIFLAQISELGSGLRDLVSGNTVDSVYDGYISGVLKSSNGKLFYKDHIKIGKLNAVDFGYKANIKQQETFSYQRVILINDSLLSCAIIAADSLPRNHKSLKPFFDGFKILDVDNARQNNAEELGYKVGNGIGILLVIAIPILIGLGIILLIRKMVYKNKKNKI